MFDVIWRLKGRLSAFALSFAAGLLVVLVFRVAGYPLVRRVTTGAADGPVVRPADCRPGDTFSSPEEVIAALRSDDVGVRRGMSRRLSLLPGLTTAYYDYERDRDFPERAEATKVERVNLDDSPDEEALITFVRLESPVAVVMKRHACGWKAVAAISSWLRFEDYPYDDWVELPEAISPGRRVLLVHDSTGDATRYTRRARALSLVGDQLEQVAEVEEEAIGPVEGYARTDWAGVKRRRRASVTFTPPTTGAPARLRVEYRDDIVRYSGVEPLNVYWREGDGVWQQARRHWRTRHCDVVKPAVVGEEQFVWSEQKNRFVPAGS
jgi:hypothetical protein